MTCRSYFYNLYNKVLFTICHAPSCESHNVLIVCIEVNHLGLQFLSHVENVLLKAGNLESLI